MINHRSLRRSKPPMLLPITDLPLLSKPRRSIVVGIGALGRSVVEDGSATAGLVVDEHADDATWQAAFSEIARRPGANCVLDGLPCIPLIVVGRGVDVRAAWNQLAERFKLAGESKLVVLVLEPGGSDAKPIPPECHGWFQLTCHYADGSLIEEELIELAVRLLNPRLTGVLLAFATRTRVSTPVTLTATLGWLPEASVREIVARQLCIQVRRSLLQGRTTPRRHPPLVPASRRSLLIHRLREQLEIESAEAIVRFRNEHAATPVSDFEATVHVGETQSLATVAEWVDEQWQAVLDTLAARWVDPAELTTVRRQIRESLEHVRQAVRAAADRELRQTRQLEPIAVRGRTADAQRIASHGRPSVRRWWRTRRVRQLLKQYYRIRTEQLLARYECLALQRMVEKLASIDARIDALLSESVGDEQALQAMLRPGHPCLFPLHDERSLRTLVVQMTDRLARSLPWSAQQQVWQLAVSDTVADLAANQPAWSHVTRAARTVASGLHRSSEAFAALCRVLPPQYRQQRLERLMLRSALPGACGSDGQPWNRASILLGAVQSDDLPANLPIAVCLQWPN